MKLSAESIRKVPCVQCNAHVGQPCVEVNKSRTVVLLDFHPLRVELAKRQDRVSGIADKLDATDKALITYYAFVMLADACSAHSVELFGKQFNSETIQKTFGRNAINELIKDGLLAAPDQGTDETVQ